MAALWNREGHYIFVLWFLSFFFFMAALRSRCGHYILQLWFLSSSFFFFSSPIFSDRKVDIYHTSTQWCGLSANLERKSEMRYKRLAENIGRKNYAKDRHLRTVAQFRRAISSQLRRRYSPTRYCEEDIAVNINISSTRPRNMGTSAH